MIEPYDKDFKINSSFQPRGDQPKAIKKLIEGLEIGYRYQTLLGATGTGKTFTMAKVIEQLNRPALVIAHNKTLAAQLCQEFREFFPDNAVEYFISFYDYYQPEAYIPGSDVYIEKDATINEEIERLRHSATHSLLQRHDVIVVASVSCIYGLGSPETYAESVISFKVDQAIDLDEVMQKLVRMQFTRNNVVLTRGTFRVQGDILEIQPKDEDLVTRIELFGDQIERIRIIDPLTQKTFQEPLGCAIFPATHYVTPFESIDQITLQIEEELELQLKCFKDQNKLLEAQRIEQRVKFDLEMIRELGYCNGIENYSRYFDRRNPGDTPYTLMDFLPSDAIVFIDESHQSIPQIRAMYNGDKQRKSVLVEHGFRLPSALDNRPLKFEEFMNHMKQVVYVSATPGPFEKETQDQVAEQVIRPTHITDPIIEIRPTINQIDDLIIEIQHQIKIHRRVLVTTLTKKMAEDLADYLKNIDVKVQYIHSSVHTLERTEILKDLRLGVYDVLIGVNLLREGLDLPEVGLVAILDADKEGFLRSDTSLIQTIGRGARNAEGKVILYADKITGSMQRAIEETDRRRAIQEAYNEKHNLLPSTVQKTIRKTVRAYEDFIGVDTKKETTGADKKEVLLIEEIPMKVGLLEKEMLEYSKALEFEKAAQIRDQIKELRKILGVL